MDELVSPQSPIPVCPSCPSGRILRSVERKGSKDLSDLLSAGSVKEVETELPQKELKGEEYILDYVVWDLQGQQPEFRTLGPGPSLAGTSFRSW